MGNPPMTANAANAPAVRIAASAGAEVVYTAYSPLNFPSAFVVYGATRDTSNSYGYSGKSFNSSPSQLNQTDGFRIVTCSDAPIITFTIAQYTYCRIFVTEAGVRRLLSPTTYGSTSSNTAITLDFSGTTGRRDRKYEIESFSHYGLGLVLLYVNVTAQDSIYAPDTTDDIRAVFIMDSWGAGSYNIPSYLPGFGSGQRMAKQLGWEDPWILGIAGTGYVSNNSGTTYTYGQLVSQALALNPQVIGFFGSINDAVNSNPTAVQAAVTAALQSVRTGGFTGPIIVQGVQPTQSTATATELAVIAGVAAANDPLNQTFFIPVATDTMPWITNNYNNAANGGSYNFLQYLLSDNLHLTELGRAYYDDRAVRSIARLAVANFT